MGRMFPTTTKIENEIDADVGEAGSACEASGENVKCRRPRDLEAM
jgi:hypothetical protein